MTAHKAASHDAWLAARKAFLAKEKELTRLRNQLNAAPRSGTKIERDMTLRLHEQYSHAPFNYLNRHRRF